MSDYLEMAREALKRDEGVVAHAYFDSEGFITIGCGRLIDKRLGGGLSDDEINYLLNNDLFRAEKTARALFAGFDRLSEARKAVLVNMAFNLGQTRLAGFQRLREAVKEQDWEQAAKEMLDSRWAKQVGNRAVRLANQMRQG
jgi:lysozyme